jgi:hypothetical protein
MRLDEVGERESTEFPFVHPLTPPGGPILLNTAAVPATGPTIAIGGDRIRLGHRKRWWRVVVDQLAT